MAKPANISRRPSRKHLFLILTVKSINLSTSADRKGCTHAQVEVAQLPPLVKQAAPMSKRAAHPSRAGVQPLFAGCPICSGVQLWFPRVINLCSALQHL